MIELTKHIEILLLENDCVIIPRLRWFYSALSTGTVYQGGKSLSSPCTYYWFEIPIDYKRWFISSIVYASSSHQFS